MTPVHIIVIGSPSVQDVCEETERTLFSFFPGSYHSLVGANRKKKLSLSSVALIPKGSLNRIANCSLIIYEGCDHHLRQDTGR